MGNENFLKRHQKTPLPPAPEVREIEHFKICYNNKAYCGHPRQGVFKCLGNGEVIIAHNHSPCEYKEPSDVAHDLGGYHSRTVVLLQRSFDGGRTWLNEENVVIYHETLSTEEKRRFLYQRDFPRQNYDMFRPESVFYFGRTWLAEDRGRVIVCFVLRSKDKGRTWEKTPTIVTHPEGEKLWVHKDCHPVLRMPEGRRLLAGMSVGMPCVPGIYYSEDNGLSWNFLSYACVNRSGIGRFSYVGLLLLPTGELQCYFLHIHEGDERVNGIQNAICMTVSEDGGQLWSEPEPIVGKGQACWKNPRGTGMMYRSPWPLLLQDGRILVLFARRRLPMGIGGVLSSDGGRTWSEEFVIRDDAICRDLGYPVACQLEDGNIFTAYYYTLPDGNNFGGTRHIAGSIFKLK